MKTINCLFSFLPFLAVLFAGLYFYQLDEGLFQYDIQFSFLLLSYLTLGIAFLFRAFIWHLLLKTFQVNVRFKISFISQFRSILMKYIPGKVWVIVGRAHYVSKEGFDLKYCSYISSLLQFIMIFTGFFVGLCGLYLFDMELFTNTLRLFLLVLFFGVLMLFSLGFRFPNIKAISSISWLQPLANQQIPPLFRIVLLCLIQWFVLGLSFYFFILSIFDIPFYSPILLQPLAINVGIVSPFAPSGLGVREGIMMGYLILEGLSPGNATSISICARIWFFLMEGLLFVIGWVGHKKYT